MYSTAGLKTWEIVAYSGIFAAVALAVATIVGITITYFVMRTPAVARLAAPTRARPKAAPSAVANRPGLAAG